LKVWSLVGEVEEMLDVFLTSALKDEWSNPLFWLFYRKEKDTY
jgi:hypothetical protein